MTYKGMAPHRVQNLAPADMSNTLFRPKTSLMGTSSRNYGAGALEASSERIAKDLAERRKIQELPFAAQEATTPKHPYKGKLEAINAELSEAQRRREWLQEELAQAQAKEDAILLRKKRMIEFEKKVAAKKSEQTEQEKKRQAAFKRKELGIGARPTGIINMGSRPRQPPREPERYKVTEVPKWKGLAMVTSTAPREIQNDGWNALGRN